MKTIIVLWKRIFMKGSFCLAAGMVLLVSCGREPAGNQAFDHVVVIISDDHSITAAGCYGNTFIRTPNIDRIAREGVRFENAYSNAPICSASRQSLLTGRYPHATGVTLLFTPFNDTRNYTVAEHLREHGFATAMVGKTHWNDWIYYNYWDRWPDFGFDTVMTAAHWRNHLRQHPPEPLPPDLPTRANATHEENTAWQKNAPMLPAPYREGREDIAERFMVQYWSRMIHQGDDTSWENFDIGGERGGGQGTASHAWSGHPTFFLSTWGSSWDSPGPSIRAGSILNPVQRRCNGPAGRSPIRRGWWGWTGGSAGNGWW